jgi:hypothetical protein
MDVGVQHVDRVTGIHHQLHQRILWRESSLLHPDPQPVQ